MTLTVGSLFAGIGGFDEGFHRAGFRCAWQVEIDPDAQRVLAHHWPDVSRFADVTECGAHNLCPVDVITFGSPCQDLSVAGKRKGMAGERSSLFFEAVRIVSELRPTLAVWENVPGALSSWSGGEPPPGHLESGRAWEADEESDFALALCALWELRPRDLAWRTLDAQYFGLAQRRQRVFLVADFGGERAAEVLFESPCRCGHPPTRSQTEADIAATIRSRSHGHGVNPPGRGGEDDQNLVFSELGEGGVDKKANLICGPLMASDGGVASADRVGELVVAGSLDTNTGHTDDNTAQANHLVCGTLNSGGNDGGFRTEPGEHLVFQANGAGSFRPRAPTLAASDDNGSNQVVAYQCHGNNVGPMGTLRRGNGGLTGGVPFVSHALTSQGADASEDGTGRGTPLVVTPIDMRQASRGETMTNNRKEGSSGGAPGTGVGEEGDPCPSLAVSHTPAVAVFISPRILRNSETSNQVGIKDGELHDALCSDGPGAIAFTQRTRDGEANVECSPELAYALDVPKDGGRKRGGVVHNMTVRRLIPVECCRLQGFPDDWLDLDPPLSDSAKYRLLGNAVAVPVAQSLAERIRGVLST